MRCVRITALLTCLVSLACNPPAPPSPPEAPPAAAEQVSFVNRVWQVADSSTIAPGLLYVFLGEGTLVIASPHGTPALGSWRDSAGTLTMTEESITRQVEVLSLTNREFRIRIQDPGEGVLLRLVPADTPPRGAP